MTRSKVKKSLALLAGGDLPVRKGRKLLAHIDVCPFCRRELEEYKSALTRIRSAAGDEGAGDWTEADWKALMARVTAGKDGRARPAWRARPRWVVTSAVVAAAVLVAAAFLLRPAVFRSKTAPAVPGPAVAAKREAKPAPERPETQPPARQEIKKEPLIQPEYLAKSGRKIPPSGSAASRSAAAQDVLSVHMVSRETGLQVVWFFNKNFEWRGDGK